MDLGTAYPSRGELAWVHAGANARTSRPGARAAHPTSHSRPEASLPSAAQPLSRSAAQPRPCRRPCVSSSTEERVRRSVRAPCPAPIAGSAPPRPPLARREAPPGPGAAGEGHLPAGSGAHPCAQRGPRPRQCPPSSVVSFSKAVVEFSTRSPDWLDEGDSSSGA